MAEILVRCSFPLSGPFGNGLHVYSASSPLKGGLKDGTGVPTYDNARLKQQKNMQIEIPKLSLIVLIGPSGSGKSTFARKHFSPTEILSSDFFRGLVSDDENNQAVSAEAFEALHYMAAKRLALGKLTVIDATNVQKNRELRWWRWQKDFTVCRWRLYSIYRSMFATVAIKLDLIVRSARML